MQPHKMNKLLSKFHFFKGYFDPKSGKPIKERIVGTLIFMGCIWTPMIFLFLRGKSIDSDRLKNPGYTVGFTTGASYSHRRKPLVDYKYYVKNVKYENWTGFNYLDETVTKGGKYLVVFEKGNPTNCELFLTCPIPNSIQYVPEDGWDSLPSWAKDCQN